MRAELSNLSSTEPPVDTPAPSYAASTAPLKNQFIETEQFWRMPDGNRLRLTHGPIDLVIEAFGSPTKIEQAYRQATLCFTGLLGALVAELEILRTPVTEGAQYPTGPVARRMANAASAYKEQYVTSMVAVAGAVADHVLQVMLEGTSLSRASINNGGDIALYLSPGQSFTIAICANPRNPRGDAKLTIGHDDGVGGIATSGWRGRSHSLGIADAVTVLADCAATADAAATMIANAVDLPGTPKVKREPANAISPDSDLGDLMVTTAVEPLSPDDCMTALKAGHGYASALFDQGIIKGAYLQVQDNSLVVN